MSFTKPILVSSKTDSDSESIARDFPHFLTVVEDPNKSWSPSNKVPPPLFCLLLGQVKEGRLRDRLQRTATDKETIFRKTYYIHFINLTTVRAYKGNVLLVN